MPTISEIAGTRAEGSPLTITGTGFTSKAAPEPLVFEKFAGGVKTSSLTNNASGGEMVYNETGTVRPRRTHSAKADYSKNSGGDGQWCSFQYNDDTAPTWYVNWWVYLPSTWHWGMDAYGGSDDGLANIKIVRFFPSGPNYTNIDAVLHPYNNMNWRRAYEHETGSDDQTLSGIPNLDVTFSLGQWHHFHCEYSENSELDAADGTFRIWVDGTPILEDTAVQTNVTGDSGGWKVKRPYVIGFWDSWGYSGPAMPLYYSDIVVDDSWARVELGDQPNYGTCTHLEYQPATAWSDGSVTVNLNYGSFNEGNTTYLFVTDVNGVRSEGFPLAVGGGTDIPSPPVDPNGGDGDGGDDVVTHTAQVTLNVVESKPDNPGDFSLTVVPLEQTIVPGETATYQVTVSPIGSFNETVNFSVSGAGTGTSESFDPPSVRGSGTSLLKVVSNANSGLGTFSVIVTGSTE